jgi:hypothetical protein
MNTDLLPEPAETIVRRIFVIRGKKVMLDADLADIYEVETRALNQAVRRNPDRFPPDFMFQLTPEEAGGLRSQNVILDLEEGKEDRRGKHSKYAPLAFTEHGALMLSAVLKSKRAVEMSIRVVRVFIQLREMLATHKELASRIERLEAGQERHDSVLSVIVEEIQRLNQPPDPPKRRIGFQN